MRSLRQLLPHGERDTRRGPSSGRAPSAYPYPSGAPGKMPFVSDEETSIELAVLRWQLIYRRNAGMPPDLDSATDEERAAYAELLAAAQLDPSVRRRLGRVRPLESLAR